MPQPIWQRDFILLWIAGMFLATSYYVMVPVLPLYGQHIGLTATEIGLLITVYTGFALLVRPFTGQFIDRHGRRLTYLSALAAFSLIMAGYVLSAGLLTLLLVRALHGVAWGALTTTGSTVAADLLPATRRGEGLGYYMLTLSVAMAVGPWVALDLLAGGMPHASLFWGAAALGAAALAAAAAIRYPAVTVATPGVRVPEDGWRRSPRQALAAMFEPRVLPLATTMFLIAITYATILVFVPLAGAETGFNAASTFFVVYAVVVALIRPFSGRYLDRHGPAGLISLSLAVMGFGYAVLTFWQSTTAFALAGLLIGFGSGISLPGISATVANRVPADRRGRANGTLFTALDLGIGVGALVLGLLADMVGLASVFAASAMASWLALGWFRQGVLSRGAHLPDDTPSS